MEIKGYCEYGCMNHRIVSLSHLGVEPVLFPEEGFYESLLYDAGQEVHWSRLSWAEDLEADTDVEFQLAFANDVHGPWSYIGPDGTAASWFTTSAGETLPNTVDFNGRYARFQARLTSDGMATPKFGNVHLSFGKAGMLSSSARNYQYDEAGNITMVTKVTDAGSIPDVRTHNDLNQITDQVVGADTWVFSYDDNGNMTGKTNGTETWTYVWNDENRLIQVNGEGVQMGYARARYGDDPYGGSLGSVSVSYTYDSMGRMLTRDDGTDLTTFTWDQFDCIREQTGMSTTTYCIPQGVLTSFIRDGDRFDVHCDALMGIRMVTDENGDALLRKDFDAWGRDLAGNFDSVPGGFHYGFVGALGCRQDPTSGLVYMRQRWYDPTMQRFVSRDPIGFGGGTNDYAYVRGNPTNFVDPSGLAYIEITYEGEVPGTSLYAGYPNNAHENANYGWGGSLPPDLPVYRVRVYEEGVNPGQQKLVAETKLATSGLEGFLPANRDPGHQRLKGRGPIPRGVYRLFCGEIADTKFPWDANVNAGDRGEPGNGDVNAVGWGGARVLLNPVRGFDKGFPFGRSETYLHLHREGSRTRTAGCVGMICEEGGCEVFDALHRICIALTKSGYAKGNHSASLRVRIRH